MNYKNQWPLDIVGKYLDEMIVGGQHLNMIQS